jgi:hypothetical protein
VAGLQYGPPIGFRGLRHAAINEQDVGFLFGMVSYKLGFIVEAVHASFPDCETKRFIDRNNRRWQHVRIEFEFQARTFKDHGHNPASCDLIVCWEHNWLVCPIEVVELRKMIDELDGRTSNIKIHLAGCVKTFSITADSCEQVILSVRLTSRALITKRHSADRMSIIAPFVIAL